MKFFNPLIQSLRLRIVGLLLLSMIPLTLGGIIWIDYYTENRLKNLAQDDLKSRGKLLAELVRRLDNERQNDTNFLASHPDMKALNVTEVERLLISFADSHRWEGTFIVMDAQGKLIAQSGDIDTSFSQSLKAWFKDQSHSGSITRLVHGAGLEHSQDCLIVPIYGPSSQEKIAALIECIPLNKISQFITQMGVTTSIDRIMFVNYNGWVYADTGNPNYSYVENKRNDPLVRKVLANQEESFYENGKFVYVLPILFRGKKTWGLILSNSEEAIQSAIADVNKVGLILVIITSSFVAYFSWRIVDGSVKPILELTQAVTAVAEGDLDYEVNIKDQDEVGILAKSFINMQNRLKGLIAEEVKDAINRLELEKGRQIQQDFLPAQLPTIEGWEIAALFEPARSVSGDFYDAFYLTDNYLCLVIGDVCDKGVGAAMFMGLFRSLLRVFSGAALPSYLQISCISDDEIPIIANNDPLILQSLRAVDLTNDYIAIEHGTMAMFATLFFGFLDLSTGKLTYINAGHEPVYVLNSQGIKHQLRSTGPAVGMMEKSIFNSYDIQLDSGDLLVGNTDGVTDARSPEGKFFGRKRLEELLVEHFEDKTNILERIKIELINHIDTAIQFDDITMLSIYRS